ncbi:metal-dependent hydrolase [Haloarcula sp. 1CSR25-25]|uniref:metal-dependent hydrolase n=1 Tax=Haloarcula sp. 1CSR25-25 TaxID=2862545 RepID=UPI0037C02CE7
MWPWEHLSVSYIAYSIAVRGSRRRAPSPTESYALLVGALFPDLVDKPAGWYFHVFPSGVSVAHSVFIAVPLSLTILLVCRYWDYPGVGTGFGVGYLLHLPQDAVYGTITSGSSPTYRVFLWPVAPLQSDTYGGFLANVRHYFGSYRELLADPNAVWFVGFEILLLSVAVFLWFVDGAPGWKVVRGQLPTRWLPL